MSSLIHRRERIIFTAIEVMNELGVQALSTKRVAQYQNIAESTVFKHFPNKTLLLQAVLDFYCQYDNDLIESIQLKALKGIQGINYFAESFMTYYENYPEITALTQGLDEMRYIEELAPTVDRIIRIRGQCLGKLIAEGQAMGEIKSNVVPEIAADVIMGAVLSLIRRWRMERYNFPLNETSKVFIGYVLEGLAVKP